MVNKCDKASTHLNQDLIIDDKIEYYIEVAQENGHLPIALKKLALDHDEWTMKGGANLWHMIVKKMPGYHEDTLYSSE